MKDIAALIEYLKNDLDPENVNQAAVVLYLLENGGRATKEDLIRTLMRYDNTIHFYYEGVLNRLTEKDFAEKDVFTYNEKIDNYFLNVSLQDVFLVEKAIRLCRQHITQWQNQQMNLVAEPDTSVGKLVRDRVPEVIAKTGSTAVTRILEGDELREKFMAKLIEEHTELLLAMNLEEIGDMMEVLFGLARFMGHDEEAVMAQIKKKREERGAFNEGIYLQDILPQGDPA